MKKYLFLAVLLLTSLFASAQYKLEKANKLYDEMAYTAAAEAYEDYVKGANPSTSTRMKIADTYYYINRFTDAVKWYEKGKSDKLDDDHFNRYIQSLRSLKQYDKADELLAAKLGKSKKPELLQNFLKQKKQLDSINKYGTVYAIDTLSINSRKSDFGTAFYGDKVVYSSAKDTAHLGGRVYKWNEQPFLDLYVAERDTITGALINEQKFMPKSHTRYHNASVAFAPDGQTIYYSTNTVKKRDKLNNASNGTNNLRINRATISGDELINEMVLPFCNIKYSVAHPALTEDGKWLIFTSDMQGGIGETDLYAVAINDDGTYGKPVNLGEPVNTPGKEMFPFVRGNRLYFASNGHYGLGGLDIFMCTISDDLKLSEPVNLGSSINSNADDFAYITDATGRYGYFSSNREGGMGDDDIYYFTRKGESSCLHTLTGIVTDATSKKPIEGVTIKVGDVYGIVVGTGDVITDTEGRYIVEEVPCNLFIMAGAFKKGYSTDTDDVTTPGAPSAEVKIDFQLVKYDNLIVKENNVAKIKINPIYFDFDKYDITPQGAQELDKVVYVMQQFPDIIIKIESHTDSRGSDDYNMVLSQNRADATYNYIIAKGINTGRIESVKGYGESQLLNQCSNDVPCTDEEHQLNRRSDFIIVSGGE